MTKSSETLDDTNLDAADRNSSSPASRILVVDDDSGIRELHRLVLMRSGYQVAVAEDGAAGWETLRTRHFDLVITDYDMPQVSGLELVMKLRFEGRTLPVVLATGTLPEGGLAHYPWLRLTAILFKPFSICQLLQTVQEALLPAPPGSRSYEAGLALPPIPMRQNPSFPYARMTD